MPMPLPRSKPTKTFTTEPWSGKGEGEKILLYGESGLGKTTLAALAPKPVFIGADDGGRKIRDPRTQQPVQHIPGIETFDDLRAALQQVTLFDGFETVVIDTLTQVEIWAEAWMFDNIMHEKGHRVTNVEGYGYGKGWTHLHDTMLLLIPDLERLMRRGKNIVILCQNATIKKANPAGDDYLQDGPKLSHPASGKHSIRRYFSEWVDHVAKIDYSLSIVKDGKAVADTDRMVAIQPEMHFVAKSRTLREPTVPFASPKDDTFWKTLLRKERNAPKSKPPTKARPK